MKHLTIHGHFYQPPRENPWLDAIETQDSAFPYHDWNERITAECYGPNARSRILDGEGFIERIVNNYERISFNFGPTLLTWLEREAPEVHAAIIEADHRSRERFSGHGSAIAQVHSHLILPLANERDKRTQVYWGVRDFEHRFGRKPEGMWLAETAVDTPTLEALAEQGIRFTILAPRQAHRVRALVGEKTWRDVDGSPDTTMPYRVNLPSGRTIDLFFYDGPLSQAVAFEGLLKDGATFAHRLVDAAPDTQAEPLVHIATDGESYGHHHRFGDMALAYALDLIETQGLAQLTNYGEYLEQHPPTHEVEVYENSSWSCVHGIERWRSDCGCNSGAHPGWNQAWRAPLRATFDWLRDELAWRFEKAAAPLLNNPWQARDAFIDLVLDPSDESLGSFLDAHTTIEGESSALVTEALKLLEMQRQAVLMFASCAWFYDDVAGIEGIQALLHAGRAIQLAEELFGVSEGLEAAFLDRLSLAKSNDPAQGDGARAYRHYVEQARVDLPRVAAHFGISSLFRDYEEVARLGPYVVTRSDDRVLTGGRERLAYGRIAVLNETTRETGAFAFAALHLGDQNLTGGVRELSGADGFGDFAAELAAAFEGGDIAQTLRLIDAQFPGHSYSLRTLFRDEQRRIVNNVLAPILEDAGRAYRRLYEERVSLMRFLASLDYPIPNRLRSAALYALDLDLRTELVAPEIDVARVRDILEEAKLAGVPLASDTLTLVVKQRLDQLASEFAAQPEDPAAVRRFLVLAYLLPELNLDVDTSRAQNALYAVLHPGESAETSSPPPDLRADFEALGRALRVRVEA